MGLADRDYIRVGPRSSSGLGNLRVISFNTWLIILNVVVFLVNNVALNSQALQIHTSMGQKPVRAVTVEQWQRRVVTDVVRPDPENPGWYYKPIVDPKTPTTDADGRVYIDRAGNIIPLEIARDRFVYMPVLESIGHFSTSKAFWPGFQVWRFITFQFLHYNFIHLLFNMLGLWFVGGLVEQHLGSKRYAAFYLTCGIFGALMYLLLNFVGYFISEVLHYGPVNIPGLLFNDPYTPLIGASAGVFGVLIAAARLEPMAEVMVYFLFPVRLRTAVLVLVLMTLFNLFTGAHNAGGEAAHVGGIIAGYYFVKRIYLLRDFFDIFGNSRLPPRSNKARSRRPHAEPVGAPARLEEEVERILAKIHENGIASLTEHEQATLRDYNERLRGR